MRTNTNIIKYRIKCIVNPMKPGNPKRGEDTRLNLSEKLQNPRLQNTYTCARAHPPSPWERYFLREKKLERERDLERKRKVERERKRAGEKEIYKKKERTREKERELKKGRVLERERES